jgi:type II secretory pathway component PulM
MTSKKYLRIGLALGFVLLSAVLLWLLTMPVPQSAREGVDDTLVRQDKLETEVKEQAEKIKKLQKDFTDSKSRISEGEKQANAAIGNMQLVV